MAARPIVPLARMRLGVPCADVRDDHDVARLASDLVDTMRASPACVGVAAPQIGVDVAAFVVDCTHHPKTTTCHGELVVVNPRIVAATGTELAREGCMSVPDLTGDVERARAVVLEGTSATGEAIVIETDGFEARAIQHEVDHLLGLLFLDRVAGPGAVHRRRVYR